MPKTLLRRKKAKKLKIINLKQINEKYSGKSEVNLLGYKILALGDISGKIKIIASSASKSAIDKVKKADGDLVIEK